MTFQQERAFEQLPGMRLVATGVAGGRPADVLVRVSGGALFVLHASGLLTRWGGRA